VRWIADLLLITGAVAASWQPSGPRGSDEPVVMTLV
jgi:hypothetical protein